LTFDKEFSLETVVIPMILFILAVASWVAKTYMERHHLRKVLSSVVDEA
jgi:positive regulator of sigma E activity